MLNYFLKKAAIKYSGKSLFDYPVVEQKKYLSKFREPRSLIERSFFQYKAQMKLKGFWISLLLNTASVPLFFIYFLMPGNRLNECLACDAVFVKDDGVNDNVLPDSLREEYGRLETKAVEGRKLNLKDRFYILKFLFKYPLSWHFALKAEIKIARYRWLISLYSPKALIVHNEYSFTSSLLTDFCNRNGVELINVMHGEKLFFMRDSFFKYNRCYIWDAFYKDLFTELRADSEQFIVEVPPSLRFARNDVTKTLDFTYYLQAQKGENLKFIVDTLIKLQEKGNTVAIRPHPRYTDMSQLNQYIEGSGIEIENYKELPIEESVLRTKNVISICSTVLQQAYYNGTKVIIDDVSNKGLYNKLAECKYIMLKVNGLKLLSQL